MTVLDWLANNPQDRARWMREGREAFGPPELWDTIEISGRDGSIRIAATDWVATKDLRMIAGADSGKMFDVNDAGRAVLMAHAA